MPAERFVLDASVAVEWFLPGGGPGGRYAEGILERIGGEELVPAVPDLWHYELGSVLIAAKRDKRISAAKLRASQRAIRGLKPETLNQPVFPDSSLTAARRAGRSASITPQTMRSSTLA